MRHFSFCVSISLIALTGCSTMGNYDVPDASTMSAVFERLQCELYRAKSKTDPDTVLKGGHWNAVGLLQLSVNAAGNVDPSLTYKGNLGSAAALYGVTVAPSISKGQKKLFQEYFTIDISKVDESDCLKVDSGTFDLAGSLGVAEAVDLASQSVDRDGGKFLTPNSNKILFSHTIEFTFSRGFGRSGPTWTLEHFVGPGSLFGATRTDVHSLQIGFVKLSDVPPKPSGTFLKKYTPKKFETGRNVKRGLGVPNNLDLQLYQLSPAIRLPLM